MQFKSKCDTKFYSLYLASLDRLCDIQLREGAGASVAADILFRMDQALADFTSISPPPQQKVVSHFKGQFYFGCANLLVKRAVKDDGSWRDTSKLVGLLYLGAFSNDITPEWSGVGSMRKVVSGHQLLSLADGDKQWSDRIMSVGSNVGERIFKAVFIVRDHRDRQSSSWLSSQSCITSSISLPSVSDISAYCPGYVTMFTSDLHMLVWLILKYYSPGKVLDLSFSLPGAGVTIKQENLTSLDLYSFLYGLVYCIGWQQEREESPVPPLPPNLSPIVTSTVQETWWNVATKVLAGTLKPADRRTLQHGVEALRCTGLHGLDVNLTMKLGKTFERMSLESGSVTDGDTAAGALVTSLDERAGLYYQASLINIERIERGTGLREPSVRLLQSAGNTPSLAEMDKMKESANFFLATQKMHQGNNGEALDAFKEIKTPYASFYTGEIYKKLALEERANGSVMDPGQFRELLVESREAFYLTLDRLRGLGGASHPLDSQLSEQLEEVENMLSSGGSDNGQEPEFSTPMITPKKQDIGVRRLLNQMTSTPQSSKSVFDGNVSVGGSARSEARPSPERLDAQMRHLTGTVTVSL